MWPVLCSHSSLADIVGSFHFDRCVFRDSDFDQVNGFVKRVPLNETNCVTSQFFSSLRYIFTIPGSCLLSLLTAITLANIVMVTVSNIESHVSLDGVDFST